MSEMGTHSRPPYANEPSVPLHHPDRPVPGLVEGEIWDAAQKHACSMVPSTLSAGQFSTRQGFGELQISEAEEGTDAFESIRPRRRTRLAVQGDFNGRPGEIPLVSSSSRGFLAEAVVFAMVIPIWKMFGQPALLVAAPLASLVACFLFGLWVGRKVESRFALHGAAVGLVATVIYVALTVAHPEPLAYVLAHGLKILGGAVGCALSARLRDSQGRGGVSA